MASESEQLAEVSGEIVSDRNEAPTVNYNWKNVTSEFKDATKELKLGELLHDDMFTLFEAMSAIEMMDPKMDAGMMCNFGNKKVLNFDQALSARELKVADLTNEEIIGIIDSTLACLVTWLEGHSLVQTVFTNLYLHKPHMIEDKVMKAFSICTLKVVDIVKNFVNRAAVFEEEDFQPLLYGYKLDCDITDVRATGMMKEVEEELARTVKYTRTKPGEQAEASQLVLHEEAVAVHSRIKFCRLFYQALIIFQKKGCSGLEEVERLLQQCLEIIPIIRRTISLGAQPDPKAEGANQADYPTVMGFEPLVNQRLLPPTFPRYTKIRSRADMTDYLESLLGRLHHICRIVECTSFHSAIDFLTEFSKTWPCVLSRSIVQMLYLPSPGKVLGSLTMVDVLKESVRAFIKPPVLARGTTLSSHQQAKEFVDAFLAHCVRPFTSLIHICGHNRARQRDKLTHLLEELAVLQDEADRLDTVLHSISSKLEPTPQFACFTTWVLHHVLKTMIQYLLSGFELELYSTHEYGYIFWYLYEFLYGWMISALSRADTFLMEQEARAEQLKGGRNIKKNKRKKKTCPHSREIFINQALQNLCGGYYKTITGFLLDGKLRCPRPDFDKEQVRYEHRFAPFNSILTPPPVQYAQYKEMTDPYRYQPPPTPEDMYLGACKCFQHVRILLENVPELNDELTSVVKVAKTNFVVVKLLLSGHKKNSASYPEFDFSQHKNFPIIRI
ncbi:N-alpha-acetyltransferase 35, NatC auxiliary subunit-like [Ornithodoros turicata]|uniref:N-alpha-acetyltransferase 35, NatC auxiliary subunit-like n=1 Tax=Ornithodoros turicata TaxID=34597 RepID=UPI003138C6BC